MLEMNQKPEIGLVQQQNLKNILIVDDEAIIRDLCSKALRGYNVVEAGDGEEALRLFRGGNFDLILTDVMMPKMGGIELLTRLKELEPTLVVIVMTGFADKDVILNALKADADDFIAKPLNLLQLRTTVEKALVKKALKEEIANLKNLDRLKSNFLSLISHKFRTPITAISLFLQNMAGGVYDPADPGFQNHLKLIFEESCYLEKLVADLLTFSSVMDVEGGLKVEPCSLRSVIMQILAESKEAAAKPGVQTVTDLADLPPVMIDREKITFALRQITDNAFKFSRDTGKVSVTLAGVDDACHLIVEDEGIGIAPEDLPKIFEKFYQVDPAHTGQIRGFGLGLYYAREFIRLHGGTISVESEAGRGSTFTVTLPIRQS
ncbi:cell wall metabolism sensor histidine kinase WalK [Geobacter sp. DSM 9736]|uniref:sensor histidine kinase n=1 Tax=Geobacter sp. DSM 9736 TaxID=1277350 RepID=UPI000B50977F|nr:hybrid sensor histidine kinase/response regulator [Geobacter sp. DSM 9736]SNB47220.1 Signal transduction histidine kinase [Geobacter sp. DSM 9736]